MSIDPMDYSVLVARSKLEHVCCGLHIMDGSKHALLNIDALGLKRMVVPIENRCISGFIEGLVKSKARGEWVTAAQWLK